MNLQHGIFVLHYFFIEYSLTFLSATQLIGIFFRFFYVYTMPYCLCAAKRIIPHTASGHTKER